MSLEYGDLFKNWEISIAKKLVKEFKYRWRCLSKESTDDLLQECLTHWYFNKNKYDPEKHASQKTFMHKVVKTKLTQIIRRYSTDKRKVSYLSMPLKIGEDEEELTFPDEHIARNRGDPAAYILKSEQVKEALAKLTKRQRKLCKLIAEGISIKEASRRLKITRRTAHRELKRIRKVFIREGVREALE